MAVLCSQCSTKVLRPEKCVVLDGNPCAACTEDMELEKEIKDLEIRIEKMQIRRRALRTTMNENHDPFIHKFPLEIASHIFIQYSPPGAFFDEHSRNNPLYLGAVCQKWRQLAWRTLELWTSLRIDFIRKYNNDLFKLVGEWLERSASLPLTIRLINHRGWFEKFPEVINILNVHSARWYDMHLDLPSHQFHHLCGSSQENILHRLVLCSSAPFKISTFSSMTSEPSPTNLTLLSVGLRYVNIGWDKLTVTSVYNIGVDECLELIRRAPLLETLTMRRIKPSSNVFPIPNTRIVRPHLHSIELSEIWAETVASGIFNSLCLPSLKEWRHHYLCFPLDDMISFIRCSSPGLKAFRITIDGANDHRIIGLLSHLSSLESLELWAFQYLSTDTLLNLLCASAQSPSYLPHLKLLECISERGLQWDSLPQIFAPASRWRRLSMRLVVNDQRSDYCDIPEQTARLLLEFLDQGIDLRIVNRDKIDLLQAHKKKWLPCTHS